MVKLLCYVTLFFSIAKPGVIVPWLGPDRALFFLAGALGVSFLIRQFARGYAFVWLPQSKYVYAIVVTYTLSIAQSGWLAGTISQLVFWSKIALLYTVVVNVCESPRDIRRALWALTLAVVALTWIAWDIYLNRPELLSWPGRLESVGDYNLSNSFALVLTMGTALVFTLFEAERGLVKRSVLLAMLIVFVVSAAFTKSRGGNLGLALTVVVSIAWSRLVPGRTAKGLLVGAVLMVALAVSLPIIMSRGDVTEYFGGDLSATDRIDAWKAGIRMTIDHPFFGVGWGQFQDYMRQYGHDKKILAHNTLISVTAETGVFGGLFFVLIIYKTLRGLWDTRLSGSESQPELVGLAQGLLICLVGFLVNTSFSVKDADPMYWAALSISGAVAAVHRRSLPHEGSGDGSAKRAPAQRLAKS